MPTVWSSEELAQIDLAAVEAAAAACCDDDALVLEEAVELRRASRSCVRTPRNPLFVAPATGNYHLKSRFGH
jgi:hypothetical protein